MTKRSSLALLIFAHCPSLSLSLSLSFNFLHLGRCSMKNCGTSHMIHVLSDRNNLTT
jgi:hypothetical protein